MRRTSWKLIVLTLLISCAAWSCTLIAEVDRSEIPTGEGGAGGAGGSEN